MSNHDIPTDLPDLEAALLVLARRMHEERPNLTLRALLDESVSDLPTGPRRQLLRLQADHALDELIRKGHIKRVARDVIVPA